jgi:hypothetical protein
MEYKKEKTVEEAYASKYTKEGKKKAKEMGKKRMEKTSGAVEKRKKQMKETLEGKPKPNLPVRKDIVIPKKPDTVTPKAPAPKTYVGDEARYRILLRKGSKKTPAERAEYDKLVKKLEK